VFLFAFFAIFAVKRFFLTAKVAEKIAKPLALKPGEITP